MTQTPGTQSYMAPEALRPNPRYDVEVDVFSFGVMLVHVLCGQWPMPVEATRVDPRNPARVIGLSEVERRAEYLDVIGRPSEEEEEGHPLMPLIERCLSNSPNLRPNASELVETMRDAVRRQPLTFSNRVDMMQRIESIQREKETLQVQVSQLEGQVERGEVAQREQREQNQRHEMALTLEVEQLQLQVDDLEAEKTHITAREELHLIEKQERLDMRERQHQDQLAAKERQFEETLKSRDDELQVKARELSSQATLISQQRSSINGLHSQLHRARQHLASGTQVSV